MAAGLHDGVRRILAPNPSPLTGPGTNTWILGTGEVAVIDPGPAITSHLQAILAAVAGQRVAAILVTHAHLDHSPLAAAVARATGAPVMAAGTALEGRSPRMERLAATGLAGGGEGLDHGFAPDLRLADGARLMVGGAEVETVATPGHMATHLSFAWNGLLFAGDHVMGWSTTLVSPPDGDMGAYMASLGRLLARPEQVYLPGHGDPVPEGPVRVAELAAHRRTREAQVLAALAAGPADAGTLARRIYTATPAPLLPAATRNVLAHLLDLSDRNLIRPVGAEGAEAAFELL